MRQARSRKWDLLRSSVLICIGGTALFALAPSALAGQRRVSQAEATLEASREARRNCQALLETCDAHSAHCLRLSPSKFRCEVEAREGREIGDLIIRETLFVIRTSRGKLIKEITSASESRVGAPPGRASVHHPHGHRIALVERGNPAA